MLLLTFYTTTSHQKSLRIGIQWRLGSELVPRQVGIVATGYPVMRQWPGHILDDFLVHRVPDGILPREQEITELYDRQGGFYPLMVEAIVLVEVSKSPDWKRGWD